jgi:hypothetical protein
MRERLRKEFVGMSLENRHAWNLEDVKALQGTIMQVNVPWELDVLAQIEFGAMPVEEVFVGVEKAENLAVGDPLRGSSDPFAFLKIFAGLVFFPFFFWFFCFAIFRETNQIEHQLTFLLSDTF